VLGIVDPSALQLTCINVELRDCAYKNSNTIGGEPVTHPLVITVSAPRGTRDALILEEIESKFGLYLRNYAQLKECMVNCIGEEDGNWN